MSSGIVEPGRASAGIVRSSFGSLACGSIIAVQKRTRRLIDEAEADADLSRLVRAERAHQRNQDTLRRSITRLEQHIATQTRLASDIDAAIAQRQDTRGEAFTMTVEGRVYRKRVDAGLHLLHLLRQEAANQLGSRQRTLRTGELGGFPMTVTISRTLGQVGVTAALDGAPGAEMTLTPRGLSDADPVGLVTRLENRLAHLEASKTKALGEIEHARSETDHATASLGKPFPQAAELAAARERSRQIDEQLEAAATPPQQDAEAGDATAVQPVPETSPVTPSGISRQVSGTSAEGVADRQRQLHESDQEHPRPPWPSAAERQAGPAPAPSHSQGTAWESPGLRQRGSALPQYRDREQLRRYPRPLADRAGEEREAGQ